MSPFSNYITVFLQFRPWIPKADSDGLSVHHCDPFHRHAYLFIAVLLVDLQFRHPLPQFRHPGFLGCIVGLTLFRICNPLLEGLFFVHHCLEPGIEDLIIHVFQHLIQQQCLLVGDVLQFLTQIDETDSTNGIASPGHCSECQHILLHFRSSLDKLVDGLLDGLMQFFFVQRGGVMAVFRSKFQPGDAPPNDPLFPFLAQVTRL